MSRTFTPFTLAWTRPAGERKCHDLHCTEDETRGGEMWLLPNYIVGSLQSLIPNSHAGTVGGSKTVTSYVTWEKELTVRASLSGVGPLPVVCWGAKWGCWVPPAWLQGMREL